MTLDMTSSKILWLNAGVELVNKTRTFIRKITACQSNECREVNLRPAGFADDIDRESNVKLKRHRFGVQLLLMIQCFKVWTLCCSMHWIPNYSQIKNHTVIFIIVWNSTNQFLVVTFTRRPNGSCFQQSSFDLFSGVSDLSIWLS